MAVTQTATVVKLGAVGDQYTLPTPLEHGFIDAIVVNSSTAGGLAVLNEGATGVGNSLFEGRVTSNVCLMLGPGLEMPFIGGFKAAATNPAGSVILVYLKTR